MKKTATKLLCGAVAGAMLCGSTLDVGAAQQTQMPGISGREQSAGVQDGSDGTAPVLGMRELFDAAYYADSYPDLKAAFGYDEEALYQHFLRYGLKEGRVMNPLLDIVKYRERYADLDAAFGDNWDLYVWHFLTYGVIEHRDNGTDFDLAAYLEAYADLREAFGTDYAAAARHYLQFGIRENRQEGSRTFIQAREELRRLSAAQSGANDGAGESGGNQGSANDGAGDSGGNQDSANDGAGDNGGNQGGAGSDGADQDVSGGDAGEAQGETVLNPDGSRSVVFYDAQNRPIREDRYAADDAYEGRVLYIYGDAETREEHYTAGGELSTVISYDEEGKKTSEEHYTAGGELSAVSSYDEEGRKTSEEHYTAGGELSTVISYDEEGRKTSEEHYIAGGELSAVSRYDEEGKKTSEERYADGALSTVISYDAEGNRTREEYYTEDCSLDFAKQYNVFGEMTEILHYNADGVAAYADMYDTDHESKSAEIHYTYDAEGVLQSHLLYIQAEAGGEWTLRVREGFYENGRLEYEYNYGYVYDEYGNQVSEANGNPAMAIESISIYTYDASGRQTGRTVYAYADGERGEKQLEETYSAAGKLLETKNYFNGALFDTITNTYYASGKAKTITDVDAKGRITGSASYEEDGSGTYTYAPYNADSAEEPGYDEGYEPGVLLYREVTTYAAGYQLAFFKRYDAQNRVVFGQWYTNAAGNVYPYLEKDYDPETGKITEMREYGLTETGVRYMSHDAEYGSETEEPVIVKEHWYTDEGQILESRYYSADGSRLDSKGVYDYTAMTETLEYYDEAGNVVGKNGYKLTGTETGAFMETQIYQYLYNAAGELIKEIFYKDGIQDYGYDYELRQKYEWSCNAAGIPITVRTYEWDAETNDYRTTPALEESFSVEGKVQNKTCYDETGKKESYYEYTYAEDSPTATVEKKYSYGAEGEKYPNPSKVWDWLNSRVYQYKFYDEGVTFQTKTTYRYDSGKEYMLEEIEYEADGLTQSYKVSYNYQSDGTTVDSMIRYKGAAETEQKEFVDRYVWSSDGTCLISRYEYDASANDWKANPKEAYYQDAEGNREYKYVYIYDTDGKLLQKDEYVKAADDDYKTKIHITEYEYYDSGKLKKETEKNAETTYPTKMTEYWYDGGKLKYRKETDYLNSPPKETWYDGNGTALQEAPDDI